MPSQCERRRAFTCASSTSITAFKEVRSETFSSIDVCGSTTRRHMFVLSKNDVN